MLKKIVFRMLDLFEVVFEKAFLKMNRNQKKMALKIWYWCFRREWMDLEHPRNFNEKMQWLKIYDSTPEKERLSDKYRVRQWIEEKIGSEYLIPLLGVWNSEKDIDFEKLPQKFVLKANHGSGMNLIVTDKSQIKEEKVRKTAGKWLKTPSGILAMEQQYFFIPRKILAEQYMEQQDGDLLDYKIHCFHGKTRFVQIIGNRKNSEHDKTKVKEIYLDLEWNRMEAMHNRYSLYEEIPEKPACLNEMLRIAEELSSTFYYVRVDLYVICGQIKFGEMTFTPAQGMGRWARKIPDEWWR